MRTREASAIAQAITARETGAECAHLTGADLDELADRLADHLAGMTPAAAMGEALAIGIVAGRRLGPAPALPVRART
jgi:hypothetical protein